MKKIIICILIALSSFSLFASNDKGNILLTAGPAFNASYSVNTKNSVESFGLDMGAEFQLGKDSHLMIISEVAFSYPCMQNFKFYNYNSSSLTLFSDFFIGLGFNTGFNRRSSFTLGAGPYFSSLNVSDEKVPLSVLSFGAEVYASAKLFINSNLYLGSTVRAGVTVKDHIGISFFDWSDKEASISSNTFTITGRLGIGYLF